MRANILRIAAAAAFVGLLAVPRAHADTRFSIQVGAPVVVAPAPVYVDGYSWQPGYYASFGYERRWVPGYWVGRHYRDRFERERFERRASERNRQDRERFDRDRDRRDRDQRNFNANDRGWRR
jgi:hypothetical protein